MRIAEENKFRYHISMLSLSVIFMAAATTAHAQSIDTRIGKLDLKLGLPTETTVEKLYDEMDFQRASQAFLWALPAVGVSGWQAANAFYGGGGDLDLVAYKEAEAVAGILTPNTSVTYVMAFPNLHKTGPVVWEIPAGQTVGIIMDFWQRPLADIGLTGPDKGNGAKLLIVGPGQKVPENATGYRVIQSPSVVAFMGVRILNPDPAVARKEFEKFRLYPLRQRENFPAGKHVWAQGKTFIQTQPDGMEYWQRLNDIIQREPVEERDRFFAAMLRPLGIEKGKPFNPDARQKKLLEQASVVGALMARINSFDKRLPGASYRQDAHWKYAFMLDPSQRGKNYEQLDERAAWFYEAIGASPAMVTNTPGVGSIYLGSYRDKNGEPLDGGKTYRLHVSPNPPMKQFWAVSIYDTKTRTLIQNGGKRVEVSSQTEGLKTNADGSVDVYIGPVAPKGFEANWVKSVPGKAWFAYFRLYAPTEAYFDQSWPLPDFEMLK